MLPIYTILPYKSLYSASHYSAISLFVSQLLEESALQDSVHVIGQTHTLPPLPANQFIGIPLKKSIFKKTTRAYYRHINQLLPPDGNYILEIHNRPDAIHYLGKENSKHILFLHNDIQMMKGFKSPKARAKLIEKYTAICCVSTYLKSQFLAGIDSNVEHIHVLPNGFKPLKSDEVPKKHQQIIFVGRMSEEKGALDVLRAACQVLPHHPAWQLRFISSANQKNSAYVKQCLECIEQLDQQIIHETFCPYNQVIQHFMASEISVLPSRWEEPFGRTILEAMGYGTALITTKQGGIPEVTGNDCIALNLAELPHLLPEKLDTLIRSPALRKELQLTAKARAINYFSASRISKQLDHIRHTVI